MTKTPVSIIELRKLQELDYEGLLSVALQAREWYDKSRWVFGDVAGVLVNKFGWEILDKFAVGMGLGKDSIQRYKTISGKFPEKTRVKYKKLSWSHFRAAATQPEPEKLLEKADDEGWTRPNRSV